MLKVVKGSGMAEPRTGQGPWRAPRPSVISDDSSALIYSCNLYILHFTLGGFTFGLALLTSRLNRETERE